MKRVAVIHYLPLEFYPPIINFLDILSKENELCIKNWSTHNDMNRAIYDNDNIKISRSSFPQKNDNILLRLLKYFIFNMSCFFGLIVFNPKKIIYFESYSAWPVYWYLKFFGRNKELLIHYHEYFSIIWYKSNMKLVKHYHDLEKSYLYKKTTWISQTNVDRVKLFLRDHPTVKPSKMKILPNYPPQKWQQDYDFNIEKAGKLKTVYIGSLSTKTTYIKDYCEWVILQNGNVIFDIYCYNLDDKTTEYLTKLNSPYVNYYKEGIEYNDIPKVLRKYNIGLILYKALIDNYKYNAPNKLFEYLACNLKVVYSDKMLGIKPYDSEQVIAVNFNDDEMIKKAVFSEPNKNPEFNWFAEDALNDLIVELKKTS